jgi:hypothetical protein
LPCPTFFAGVNFWQTINYRNFLELLPRGSTGPVLKLIAATID